MKKRTSQELDKFMKSLGYHKHKQNYRGKAAYFMVGGFGMTRMQAEFLYQRFNAMTSEKTQKYIRLLHDLGYVEIEDKEYIMPVQDAIAVLNNRITLSPKEKKILDDNLLDLL